MSKRDIRMFLSEFLEAVQKIDQNTVGVTLIEFEENEMAINAIVRNLEIIGETARHFPELWIHVPE